MYVQSLKKFPQTYLMNIFMSLNHPIAIVLFT